MLKKVTITNYLDKSVEYSFEAPTLDDESGLLITEIEGLGPVKADINMTELATADGQIWNSSRLNGRNIVIHARFTYAKSIEDARLLSYKYFPIGHPVTFKIETDNRIAQTTGYVESNEPNIFSENSDVQISILCESPFFISADEDGTKETKFSSTDYLFEFEFENDDVSEPMLEFGNIVNKKENSVYYEGDAETGAIIRMHAVGLVRNISIYNIKTRESMTLETTKLIALTGAEIGFGDDIIVSTIKGRKSITLLRNGVSYNIINILGKDSDWFQLAKGDNLFAFVAEEGETNLQFKITSQIIFEGV